LQAGDSKETNLAMMRLVWWRDAVDGIYKVFFLFSANWKNVQE
jgi:hypothetical protein